MDGWARPNVAVQPGSECAQRGGCSAECCQRLMGGGGHIVSAPTKQEGASRASVHMQGLCDLARCAWCRLGGGWTQSSTWTFQWCTKHPWGPVWRCTCVGGVTTCASESGSGMQRNPTGDDWVSSAHKHRSRAKVVSSTTALAHWFPPPSSSGC